MVSVLMQSAMVTSSVNFLVNTGNTSGNMVPVSEAKEEPTLKVILSALWNLSSHGRKNKVIYGLLLLFHEILGCRMGNGNWGEGNVERLTFWSLS